MSSTCTTLVTVARPLSVNIMQPFRYRVPCVRAESRTFATHTLPVHCVMSNSVGLFQAFGHFQSDWHRLVSCVCSQYPRWPSRASAYGSRASFLGSFLHNLPYMRPYSARLGWCEYCKTNVVSLIYCRRISNLCVCR